MHSISSASLLGFMFIVSAGCSGVDDFQPLDAARADVGVDAGPGTDMQAVDVSAGDAAVSDASPQVDVAQGADVAPADAMDVSQATDAAVADTGDVAVSDSPMMDVPRRDVPAPDAMTSDVTTDRPTGVDAPPPTDGACPGAAPVVAITAPRADEEIETCSGSGGPVYYEFRAAITSAAIRSVTAQWRTPDGSLAPPPPPPLGTPPYVWRRQVGGMMVDVPPLAVFSGALRGAWRFEVTATDTCGRSTSAMQSFTLIFTSRRCPNP